MNMGNISALVLEDNANMRALIRAILVSFGLRSVVEASDAYEALQVVQNSAVDLAFVDFQLAGLDGLEFCRLIRTAKDSPNPFLPIIMITGYSERTRVKEAIDAGVDEFLVKPVRPKDVAVRINAVVERRRSFVRSKDYFGPDRRRKATGAHYSGPLRRADDGGFVDI